MRPRVLYWATFTWLVMSGGRFTSLLLEKYASFNATWIGIAMATQVFIGALLGPVAGVLADVLERRYTLYGRMYVILLGLTLATLSFEFHFIIHWILHADNTATKTTTTTTKTREDQEQNLRLWEIGLHMTVRIFFSIGMAIIFPVLDGFTLAFLEQNHMSRLGYGKERLHGALSWALASILIGPALDSFGFNIFFIASPISYLICVVVVLLFMQQFKTSQLQRQVHDMSIENEEASHHPHSVLLESRQQQRQKDEIDENSVERDNRPPTAFTLFQLMIGTVAGFGFIMAVFTLNMGTSVVENMIFLFFEKLGASNSMCGLTVLITVIFEIPIFHFAARLLGYFGCGKLLSAACVAYIVRVVGYTYIPQGKVGWVLLLEPLHGVTYACSQVSSVDFTAKLVPKGSEASGQGLIGLVRGLGSVSGLLLGGWMEDSFGSVVMYRVCALIVLWGLIIFHLCHKIQHEWMKSATSDDNESIISLPNVIPFVEDRENIT